MNVIVMGPVGSGKSTQAELISKHFDISHFNAGDLLYFKSLENTDIGKKIANVMKRGGLVDNELVLGLVREHIDASEHKGGVVIDGFPRSLWQAENFKLPINWVIYLVVSDKVNTERLLKRGRGEDTKPLIVKRLELYHRETEPILDFYRKKGILIEVNGERPVDVIFEDIVERINQKNAG